MNENIELDNILELSGPFTAECKTNTFVAKGGKLLIPPTSACAKDIDRVSLTLSIYDFSGKTLRVSHSLLDRTLLSGAGVKGEQIEDLNYELDPNFGTFNIYGYDYDSDFKDFMPWVAQMDLSTSIITPTNLGLNHREVASLGDLCLSRAVVDLRHMALSGIIVSNV